MTGIHLRGALAGALLSASALFGFSAAAEDLYGPIDGNATRGGTLNMGLLVEPPALDPFHQAADARIRVSLLMYQGLFYEGAGGEAVPLLAEGYDVSDDGLVYTIRLRQGVKFHDGSEMDADDVAYSYNYLRDPANGSPGAGDFAIVQSVEAVDSHTVRFTLTQPNASLPMTLGNKYGAVVPAGYFDDENARNRMNEVSVGTGPFKLVEFNPNSNLLLARHEEYWEEGAPYLDEINFSFLPNSASMLVALRNGRVDLVKLERPQDVQQVREIEGLEIERWPSLNQKAIDLGSELKPLDDVRVRQAIALAVDREQIMQGAVGEFGQVIYTMVAGMEDAWGVAKEDLPNMQRDVEAAKKLLAEAGLSNGFDLTLTTINGYDWMDPAAVTLREQLAEIGVNLEIQRVDLGVWVDRFRSRQMGFTFNDWATQPDPNLLFYRHFHKQPEGADFRNWNHEEASRLLDEGRAENDPQKRREIYNQFQKVLAESVPTIMLFSADHVTVRTRP
jgi:peptide/nickel transport system substrate-binding protein